MKLRGWLGAAQKRCQGRLNSEKQSTYFTDSVGKSPKQKGKSLWQVKRSGRFSLPATSMPPSNSCEGLGRAGSTWCSKHGPRTDRWSEHHVSIQKETENARSRTGSWKTVESMQEDVESESNWSNCSVESRPWCSSSSGCPGRAQHHWRCGNSHSLVKNSWSWNRCSTCPATKPTRSSSFSIHSPIPSPIQKQNIPIPNGPKYMVSSPTSTTVSVLRLIYVIWNGDGINDSWLSITNHSIYIHVYIHIDIDIYIYILYIYMYISPHSYPH